MASASPVPASGALATTEADGFRPVPPNGRPPRRPAGVASLSTPAPQRPASTSARVTVSQRRYLPGLPSRLTARGDLPSRNFHRVSTDLAGADDPVAILLRGGSRSPTVQLELRMTSAPFGRPPPTAATAVAVALAQSAAAALVDVLPEAERTISSFTEMRPAGWFVYFSLRVSPLVAGQMRTTAAAHGGILTVPVSEYIRHPVQLQLLSPRTARPVGRRLLRIRCENLDTLTESQLLQLLADLHLRLPREFPAIVDATIKPVMQPISSSKHGMYSVHGEFLIDCADTAAMHKHCAAVAGASCVLGNLVLGGVDRDSDSAVGPPRLSYYTSERGVDSRARLSQGPGRLPMQLRVEAAPGIPAWGLSAPSGAPTAAIPSALPALPDLTPASMPAHLSDS